MRQVSESQKKKNAAVAKIKSQLMDETGPVCRICQNYGYQAAHLLPKGEFPEYYTEPRNIVLLCHEHHDLYDNNISFRKQQTSLISQCREYALESDITRYFKL